MYVECYRFLIFVVTDSVYYKYQYSKTYTLCSGLNRLQVYVTEIKEKQIFQRIRWQLRIFESVFYKSLIRACSFGNSLAASQNARSNSQTSNHRRCEFVKNALKKCSCLPPDSLKYLFFFYFRHIHASLHFKSILFLPINLCYD